MASKSNKVRDYTWNPARPVRSRTRQGKDEETGLQPEASATRRGSNWRNPIGNPSSWILPQRSRPSTSWEFNHQESPSPMNALFTWIFNFVVSLLRTTFILLGIMVVVSFAVPQVRYGIEARLPAMHALIQGFDSMQPPPSGEAEVSTRRGTALDNPIEGIAGISPLEPSSSVPQASTQTSSQTDTPLDEVKLNQATSGDDPITGLNQEVELTTPAVELKPGQEEKEEQQEEDNSPPTTKKEEKTRKKRTQQVIGEEGEQGLLKESNQEENVKIKKKKSESDLDDKENKVLTQNKGLKKETIESKPDVAESEPDVAESELTVAESELVVAESEPDVAESDPVIAESEPDVAESELVVAESEPDVAESDPVIAESEPDVAESQTASTKVDMKPVKESKSDGAKAATQSEADGNRGKVERIPEDSQVLMEEGKEEQEMPLPSRQVKGEEEEMENEKVGPSEADDRPDGNDRDHEDGAGDEHDDAHVDIQGGDREDESQDKSASGVNGSGIIGRFSSEDQALLAGAVREALMDLLRQKVLGAAAAPEESLVLNQDDRHPLQSPLPLQQVEEVEEKVPDTQGHEIVGGGGGVGGGEKEKEKEEEAKQVVDLSEEDAELEAAFADAPTGAAKNTSKLKKEGKPEKLKAEKIKREKVRFEPLEEVEAGKVEEKEGQAVDQQITEEKTEVGGGEEPGPLASSSQGKVPSQVQRDEIVKELVRPGCKLEHFTISKSNKVGLAVHVVNHTLSKIIHAEVKVAPFQYMHIQSIFLPSFYECMLAHLPKPSSGTAGLQRTSHQNPEQQQQQQQLRHTLDIHRPTHSGPTQEAATAAGVDRLFWRAFTKSFASHEMALLWVTKFRRTTGPRLQAKALPGPWQEERFFKVIDSEEGSLETVTNFTYDMDFARDVNGFHLLPHADSGNRWVSTIYYLPKSNANRDAGTQVLISRSGKLAKGGSGKTSWEDGDFKVARSVPFAPNSVFAFAPCWSSWHAVKPFESSTFRDTIQGYVHSSIKISKEQCASAPEL